jgi:Contact-dependent growth inhibition CdiA C-terminal domain
MHSPSPSTISLHRRLSAGALCAFFLLNTLLCVIPAQALARIAPAYARTNAPACAPAYAHPPASGLDSGFTSVVAALTGANPNVASSAAYNEAVNNYLTSEQRKERDAFLASCGNSTDPAGCELRIRTAYEKLDRLQDEAAIQVARWASSCKNFTDCQAAQTELARIRNEVISALTDAGQTAQASRNNALRVWLNDHLTAVEYRLFQAEYEGTELMGALRGVTNVLLGIPLGAGALARSIQEVGALDTFFRFAEGTVTIGYDLATKLKSDNAEIRTEAAVELIALLGTGGVANYLQRLSAAETAALRAQAGQIEARRIALAAGTDDPFMFPGSSVNSPSSTAAGELTGRLTVISKKHNEETKRALERENESATILANNGYKVEQNPPTLPNGKNPDYLVNWQIFDNYAPSTGNVRNIASGVADKVFKEQASNIVVNLADSKITPAQLKLQLTSYPIPGLKEVIIIDKSGAVATLKFNSE